MKIKYSFMVMAVCILVYTGACTQKKKGNDNPFFGEFTTPYGVPPFDLIKNEHYKPAFLEGMKQHDAEIRRIADSKDAPTFENTIVALDNSGEMLRRVSDVFENITSANTSPELQKLAQEMAPELSQHYDNIQMDAGLFKRIQSVYDEKEKLNLSQEQLMLLELTYKGFVRNGALLNEEQKKKLSSINKELSVLTLQFGDNLLAENNNYTLAIDNEKDLSGLSPATIEAAAETATEKGMKGKWVFTLQNPSVMPFLQFADNRELRKQIQQAYVNRCNNGNKNDNKDILKKTVSLRLEKAKLLGYNTHADFILEMNMAKNPKNVFELLNKIWQPALRRAISEAESYQNIGRKNDKTFKLEAWDWRYYAEKFRKEKYDLDEEQLKPYFSLNNVKDGVFYVCSKLYDIKFIERNDIPKYHKDVQVYEVKDKEDKHIGILYLDFYARESKQGGAWMNAYRNQYVKNGKFITPIISVVCNFTKPTANQPTLCTLDEVETLFHEMGHAMHGLLSKGTYLGISGTSVPRDFVELPSQIMEHWATEPEVLRYYAKHFKTNEPMPEELIKKIQNSTFFDQGFATVEFLASAFLDMYWHTMVNQEEIKKISPVDFENTKLSELGLITQIYARHRSTYFAHVFSGGYSAGYYSYLWCSVLDNDAFMAFKEKGIFDKETANLFRTNILEKGHSDDPMTLYKAFRGKEPSIEPLLEKRGLK